MPRATDEIYEDLDELGVDEIYHEPFFDYLHRTNKFDEFRKDGEALFEEWKLDYIINSENKTIDDYIRSMGGDPDIFPDVKFFEVGCAFTGIDDVEFEETEDYVIFSSPYCFDKLHDYCSKNYPNLIKTEKEMKKKDFTTNSKQIDKYFKLSKKIVFKSKESKKNKLVYYLNESRRYGHKKQTFPYLLLCHMDKTFVHCVLIKSKNVNKITLNIKPTKPILTNDDSNNQYPMESLTIKNPLKSVIVFDVEATNAQKQIHNDIAVGAYELFFTKEGEKLIIDESKYKLYNTFNEFILDLDSFSSNQIFAHNNGGYDCYFLLKCPFIKIFSDNYVCGKFKSLKFRVDENFTTKKVTYEMKDSLSFYMGSLYKFNISTNNPPPYIKHKDEYKIELGSITEKQKENPIFYEYLKYDVLSLAYSLNVFEQWMNKLNSSITTSLGIPGATMTTFRNMYPYKDLYCAKSHNIRMFQRQSVYGGRVLHHHKTVKNFNNIENFAIENDPLISLDCNSLYPEALRYEYPVGKFSITQQKDLKESFIRKFMGIYEVELDGGNLRYPIVPYRETHNSVVIYPSNVFRGVYTTIDIISALSAGYKITQIYQGIYWKKKRSCFKEYIEFLYNKRLELKKVGNEAEEVYKLFMNSFFGKFLEKVNRISTYKKPKFPCRGVKFPNGQTRYTYEVFPACRYPIYVGSFVLSYARAVMNRLFVNLSPERIYYSDTDSIYIHKSDIKINQSKLLGEFKNDYIEKYIDDFIFADYKRYYLKFDNGEEKIKCNGLRQTTENLQIKDKKEFMMKVDSYDGVDLLQERWIRDMGQGIMIDIKAISFIASPKTRRIWKDNDSWPLDFDFTKEEREFNYIDHLVSSKEIKNPPPYIFSPDKKSILIQVPLKFTKSIGSKKKVSNIAIFNGNFVRLERDNLVLLDEKGGVRTKKKEPEMDINYFVIAMKSAEPNISEEEMKKILHVLETNNEP